MTLLDVFDEDYALVTTLAPVWLPSPMIESVARDLETYDAQDDVVVAALARLYRESLHPTNRADRASLGGPLPDHPGVELLQRFNECRGEDVDRRRIARERLGRATGPLPPWAQAWARYAIGRSLVAEDELSLRQAGAVSLVYLPARFGRTQPFLAGLALMHLADVLAAIGDQEAATTVRLELQRRYPNHPLHTTQGPSRPAGPRKGQA